MKRLYPLVTCCLVLYGIVSHAQVITVLDKTLLKPISMVSIYRVNKSMAIETDQEGKADLSGFAGDDTLVFRHLGYQQLKLVKASIEKDNKVYLTENIIQLDALVLSANKTEEKMSDVPVRIEIIKAKDIEALNPQTSADMLQQTGKVFVQQSQLGGGSPVLRGFEANKVLLVVDGVRMNNTIYRSGHLQNVITIDPNTLEKVEIVFGPGSVIYGSDALGGVMHFITRDPELANKGKFNVWEEDIARFSSADMEFSGNITMNFGFKKLGFLTSVSSKKLGDLRMGADYDPQYGDWGKRRWYAETIDGVDTMMENSKITLQKFSGYNQYDILQKILWKPSDGFRLIINFQFSNTSDIPRYDRLTEMKGNDPKYAEWYYGPQMRIFGSVKAELTKAKVMYDRLYITAAYQRNNEDRVTRNFDASGQVTTKKRQYQEERINVASLNMDLLKQIGKKNELRYGLEADYNYLKSQAYREDIFTTEKTYDYVSRYPDNGISHLMAAAYISHSWEISEKFIFSQGIRYSYSNLTASYTDTMFALIGKPPISLSNKLSNSAVNGSLGIVYMPGLGWRLALSGSSGFRAPNTDDAFKFNDSKVGDVLMVPNPGLKPEYAYNGELTVSKLFWNKMLLGATGFYTYLVDAIKIADFPYNGSDSTLWNGSMCITRANVNVENAYKYGVQAEILVQPLKWLSLSSTISWTVGRDMNGDPLDHIPPVYGLTSVKFEIKKFMAEIYSRYNFEKKYSDYNLEGEDNVQAAPKDNDGNQLGLPGWYTLNFRCAYTVANYLKIQAGVDNILDKHYRIFASGISAPGRNIIISLKARF